MASLIEISRGESIPINTERSRQHHCCSLDHRPCNICSLCPSILCFTLTPSSLRPPNSPQTLTQANTLTFVLLSLADLLWENSNFPDLAAVIIGATQPWRVQHLHLTSTVLQNNLFCVRRLGISALCVQQKQDKGWKKTCRWGAKTRPIYRLIAGTGWKRPNQANIMGIVLK